MSSFIFESRACRHCDQSGRNPARRRVLRTLTEDICCEGGGLLQTFPAATTTASGDPDLILIPEAVSEVLAKLLKQRLFVLDIGSQPQRADRETMDNRTPAHRVGDQLVIQLRGPGNGSAELRWSYSNKKL